MRVESSGKDTGHDSAAAPRLGLVVPGTPPDAARSCGRDHRSRPVIPPVTGDPRQQLGRCDRIEGLHKQRRLMAPAGLRARMRRAAAAVSRPLE